MAAVPCMWAQSKEQVVITFEVTDTSNPTVEAKENKLTFRCTKKGGTELTKEIELFKEVTSDVKVRHSDRDILCTLKKASSDDHSFWPRLTKHKVKDSTIKVDFGRWKDESDDEYGDDFNFDNDMSSMMAGMGDGMGGMGGMGMDGMGMGMDDDEEPDSDDEDDMPDLEDATSGGAPKTEETPKPAAEEATGDATPAAAETTS